VIELILVRHGDAEPKAEGKEDRERRLVEKGVIQIGGSLTSLSSWGSG
jgi:phosphohistidine phosphatase